MADAGQPCSITGRAVDTRAALAASNMDAVSREADLAVPSFAKDALKRALPDAPQQNSSTSREPLGLPKSKPRSNSDPDKKTGSGARGAGRSSRFKGVTKRKGNRWMAYLYCRGRQHNSKEFHDELDAAHWYDVKALELFGPAAVLNFPQDTQGAVGRPVVAEGSPGESNHGPDPQEPTGKMPVDARLKGPQAASVKIPKVRQPKRSKGLFKSSPENKTAQLKSKGENDLLEPPRPEDKPRLSLMTRQEMPSSGEMGSQEAIEGHPAATPGKGTAASPGNDHDHQSAQAPLRDRLSPPQAEAGTRPEHLTVNAMTFCGPHPGTNDAAGRGSLDFLAAAAAELASLQPHRQYHAKQDAEWDPSASKGVAADARVRHSSDRSRSSRSAVTFSDHGLHGAVQRATAAVQIGARPQHHSDSPAKVSRSQFKVSPRAEIQQRQPALSSCSGSTVSLPHAVDPHSDTAHTVQRSSAEFAVPDLPRWGAKRRATNRCSGKVHSTRTNTTDTAELDKSAKSTCQAEGPLEQADKFQSAQTASAVPVSKAPWIPGTPYRHQDSPDHSSSAEQQCYEQQGVPGVPGHQSGSYTDRQLEPHDTDAPPSTPPSQHHCPSFSVDPVRRPPPTGPAGAVLNQQLLLEVPLLPSSLHSIPAGHMSLLESCLRQASHSSLQLAPPSLPQMSAQAQQLSALKLTWMQQQQQQQPLVVNPSQQPEWPKPGLTLPHPHTLPATEISRMPRHSAHPDADLVHALRQQFPGQLPPHRPQNLEAFREAAAPSWPRMGPTPAQQPAAAFADQPAAGLPFNWQAGGHGQSPGRPHGFPKMQPDLDGSFPQLPPSFPHPHANFSRAHPGAAPCVHHHSAPIEQPWGGNPQMPQGPSSAMHAAYSSGHSSQALREISASGRPSWPNTPHSHIPPSMGMTHDAAGHSKVLPAKRKDPHSAMPAGPLAGTPFAAGDAPFMRQGPPSGHLHRMHSPHPSAALGAGFQFPPQMPFGGPDFFSSPSFAQMQSQMPPQGVGPFAQHVSMAAAAAAAVAAEARHMGTAGGHPHAPPRPASCQLHSPSGPCQHHHPHAASCQLHHPHLAKSPCHFHAEGHAQMKAGRELLQALRGPAELPPMGLADLTNQANAAVSMSAGLLQQMGASPHGAVGPEGAVAHALGLLHAEQHEFSEGQMPQSSRPDLTAAIKGLGTASLGATLLLKAALQKQQSAPQA